MDGEEEESTCVDDADGSVAAAGRQCADAFQPTLAPQGCATVLSNFLGDTTNSVVKPGIGGLGGACHVKGRSSAMFTAALFEGNHAEQGGAVYMTGSSTTSFIATLFKSNSADQHIGGAVCITGSSYAAFTTAVFESNYAEIGGGAIFIGATSFIGKQLGEPGSVSATFTETLFKGNIVGKSSNAISMGGGGAIYISVDSTAAITTSVSTTFTTTVFEDNGGGDQGEHILANNPTLFKISDSTFTPLAAGTKSVSLNALGGCQQYPCGPGFGCTYGSYSLSCTPCTGTVSLDGITCQSCAVGQEPNADRTVCVLCAGNKFSPYGVSCDTCTPGKKVNPAHNGCDDISEGTVDDALVVTDVLLTSNVVPQMCLEMQADAATLISGSAAQAQLVDSFIVEIATALPNVEVQEVSISGIRAATGVSAGPSGRRRVQDVTIAFDVTILSSNSAAAITELSAQLAVPASTLLQGALGSSIDPASMAFKFTCPVGMHRPSGDKDCRVCSGNRIPSEDIMSCIPCPSRQSPDPRTTGTTCTCAANYYNSTHSSIKCYDTSQYYSPLERDHSEDCMPCGGMTCVDCSKGYVTDVLPGYSMSTSALEAARANGFNSVADQRAIYPCPLCELGDMDDCPCEGLPIDPVSDFLDPTTGTECKTGLCDQIHLLLALWHFLSNYDRSLHLSRCSHQSAARTASNHPCTSPVATIEFPPPRAYH
jgi:predicted outer membrane repeat protein